MTEPPQGWAVPGPAPGGAAAPPGYYPPTAAYPPPYAAQSGVGPPGAGWGAPRPPELKPGIIPLRPLGLGEILDGAIALIRRYPRPVLGLSAIIAVVATALSTLFLLVGDVTGATGGFSTTSTTAQIEGRIGASVATAVLSAVVSLLAGVLLSGVITAVIGRGVLGRPMTFQEAWAQVRPLLPRLLGLALLTPVIVAAAPLGAGIVTAVLVAAGGPVTLVLGIPLVLAALVVAAYLSVRLALAPSALVLEGAGIRESLRRSTVLVRRSWWRVAALLFLAAIIAAFLSAVLQFPIALVGGFTTGAFISNGPSLGLLVAAQVAGGLARTIVSPFSTGVRALIYVDRRMRAEGLDMTLAAAARGGPAG